MNKNSAYSMYTKTINIGNNKDCVEDLRVYPTRSSQDAIDRAMSIKAGSAELIYAYIDVEPISFNRGFYTVDVRYFYRITADAFVGASRPVEVTGLAVFDKRAVLFGSEGSAKVFTSRTREGGQDGKSLLGSTAPVAVVEAVDPLILGLKLLDVRECGPTDCGCVEIPPAILGAFSEELVTSGDMHRLYVTLGQFSMIRLERDTQMLMPVYDYCVPEKECGCEENSCEEQDPCEVFRQVQFPVDEFFPPNSITSVGTGYPEVRTNCR